MRRVLFWTHLTGGVTAGLIIFVMCVSGVVLAFERQIVSWTDARGRAPVSTNHAGRVPLASILNDAGQPSNLTISADLNEPLTLAFGRERTVFVDPYTGKILGEGNRGVRSFFGIVERWHRALGQPLQRRGAGRALTGAANFVFLGLVMSGLFLWIPRRRTRRNLRRVLMYRTGLAGRARNWNWHNVTGVWSAIPLFVIVLSGVVMSYQWANDLVYRLSGSPLPVAAASIKEARSKASGGVNLDILLALAAAQVPDWKTISLRLPLAGKDAAFTIDTGNGGQPAKRSQLTLSRADAHVVKWEPFDSNTLGRRLRTWARFAHTGEAGGLPGQTIAALATAGGAFLVWTGLALALHRWKRSRARIADIEPAEAELV